MPRYLLQSRPYRYAIDHSQLPRSHSQNTVYQPERNPNQPNNHVLERNPIDACSSVMLSCDFSWCIDPEPVPLVHIHTEHYSSNGQSMLSWPSRSHRAHHFDSSITPEDLPATGSMELPSPPMPLSPSRTTSRPVFCEVASA